jgi:uncharacterized protein (TIGR02145 family)
MSKKTNSFEQILKKIVNDFGGVEIFSEENYARLNKALLSLSPSLERSWLLIANMEHIPQTLYTVKDSSQSTKQKVVETSRDALVALMLDEDVCEKIVLNCMQLLKINANVQCKPIIEKQIEARKLKIRYKTYSKDIQKNCLYKTCIIGRQEWFAENFHQEKGHCEDDDMYGDSLIGELCARKDFGRVYNWLEAKNNVPEGWRLPTLEDFQEMVAYIESLRYDAGSALKSTIQWHGKADSGLDLFGFCAYPTVRDPETKKSQAWFWTASETGDEEYPHYCVSINADSNDVELESIADDDYHACVRYVRDVE